MNLQQDTGRHHDPVLVIPPGGRRQFQGIRQVCQTRIVLAEALDSNPSDSPGKRSIEIYNKIYYYILLLNY
jgi:hypothetical protein